MNGDAISLRLQATIDRISHIDWENGRIYRPSHVPLTQEYLRRILMWKKATKCSETFGDWPHLDIAKCLHPELELPERIRIQVADVLGQSIDDISFCYCFIRWIMVKENDEVQAFNLPDPFEPIMLSFERGNRFSDYMGRNFKKELSIEVKHVPNPSGRGGRVRIHIFQTDPDLYDGVVPFVPDEDMNTETLDKFDIENQSE